MAEDKIEISRDLLKTLLEDRENRQREREEAKAKHRKWLEFRTAAKKKAKEVVGHWGSLAILGGAVAMACTTGYLNPYTFAYAANVAGKIMATVGAAALVRDAASDALGNSIRKDEEQLLLTDGKSQGHQEHSGSSCRYQEPEILEFEDEEVE